MGSILCADIGTTSLKIGIINNLGEVVSFCIQQFQLKNDSFLANEWFKSFIRGAEDCIDACEYVKDFKLDAICISGNGPTIVSDNGRTLLWNQDKFQDFCEADLKSFLSKFPSTDSLYLPRFALFKKIYKEDYQKAKYIFSGVEYLIYRLTECAVSILPETRFKNAYWTKEGLKDFEIDENKIPKFVSLGYNAGLIKRGVYKKIFTQKQTGKSGEILWKISNQKRIPVFCGGPDFITALIGTNTLRPGRICDRAGSSEGINLCVENPIFDKNVRTLPSVIPGLWNVSFLIGQSGSLINEFRTQIDLMENRYNSFSEIIDFSFDDKNSEGYRIFNELCKKVKNGVEILKNLAIDNKIQFENMMVVTGGQAKNDRWLAAKAKSVGINLSVTKCPDAELLGNAIIAKTGLGEYSDFGSAANDLVKYNKVYSATSKKESKLKAYKIPRKCSAIIFDIDSTLYTNSAYAFEQVDVQIREFAKKKGINSVQARNIISEWRKNWSHENGGKKISLGNTLIHFGVTIDESVKMRESLLEPANYLTVDKKLIDVISKLKKEFKLICVTNNPIIPAKKTLDAIGIGELITEIIGLDTCGVSKPAKEPFELAVKLLNVPTEEIISVGDRYDMDLSLPLDMGMGAILVGGVEDVYLLPDLLLNRN